jgi:hypothetical protein
VADLIGQGYYDLNLIKMASKAVSQGSMGSIAANFIFLDENIKSCKIFCRKSSF